MPVQNIWTSAQTAFSSVPTSTTPSTQPGLDSTPSRELSQVGLAEQDGSCVAELLHQKSITRRNRTLKSKRTCCRRHSVRGGDIVLQQDRNPVERTARPLRFTFSIE